MAKRVLVLGDIMLDHYIHVVSTRRAAEAPIPVWDQRYDNDPDWRLGGAANVANNMKALGNDDVEVMIAGITDRQYLIQQSGIQTGLTVDGFSMVKTRYVESDPTSTQLFDGKILFRFDDRKRFDNVQSEYFEEYFTDAFVQFQRIDPFDIVVVSDYDKGTISPKIMRCILDQDVPVVVDSKRNDLSMYEGMDVLKLNHYEFERQVTGAHPYVNVERLTKALVVTKGSQGAELRVNDVVKTTGNRYVTHIEQFPIESLEPVDVTGCGDTHTAGMAFSLLHDPLDLRRAIKFANACASSVVRKFGTSVVQKPTGVV